MISAAISRYENLPNIWGEGAIFAFSGMDGETCSRSEFVFSFAAQPYGFLIQTPTRRILEITPVELGRVLTATNDVLSVETPQGELLVTFAAWHTLVGRLPENTRLGLRVEDGPEIQPQDNWWVSDDPKTGDVLALTCKKQNGESRFSLAYGSSADEARSRAQQALGEDLETLVEARLAIYQKLPRLKDPARDRLLKKCASVMKVNTLAAEGTIPQSWSTPDRVPHQNMWLWDSVFHSITMNHIHPRLAADFLKSVLDQQLASGMIPHMMRVNGRTSEITQPPILAWGIWENFQALHDRDFLAYAFPRLERYLEWDLTNRDQNGNGLLEWFIEGDVRCRSGESGLDNSPRFDEAILLDAVDFSTFAALDMLYLSRIAHELGQTERAGRWQARAEFMSSQIHALLWNEREGFYFDRKPDGQHTGVWAVTGFLPLLLPDLPKERAERLVMALKDPQKFCAAFPVPSVSMDHPEWSTDMWRGATWLNMNDFVMRGLLAQGYEDEARWLAEKSIFHVNKYYQQYGVLFEFYDAKDERPPAACDRKGPHLEPYNFRRKYDSIRDYHWTAAITARLLLQFSEKP